MKRAICPSFKFRLSSKTEVVPVVVVVVVVIVVVVVVLVIVVIVIVVVVVVRALPSIERSILELLPRIFLIYVLSVRHT